MMKVDTPLELGVSQGLPWRWPGFGDVDGRRRSQAFSSEGRWAGTVLNGRTEGQGCQGVRVLKRKVTTGPLGS